MIQVNELRIGNWVDNSKGFLYQIKRSDFELTDFNITMPIPITPEILEKCGFVLISKNSYWCFKNEVGFVLCMWMADSCVQGFEVKGSFYYGDSYIEIKYLHQLQNLYFALTGKELTVNL